MIGRSVIKALDNKENQIKDPKVKPIYKAKRQGGGRDFMRAYYTVLYEDKTGERTFALLAAHRTKGAQKKIVSILSYSTGTTISES